VSHFELELHAFKYQKGQINFAALCNKTLTILKSLDQNGITLRSDETSKYNGQNMADALAIQPPIVSEEELLEAVDILGRYEKRKVLVLNNN